MKILPLIAACALLATGTANASTFTVSGTATNVSSISLGTCASGTICNFSGTLEIDVTAGAVTGLDITFSGMPGFNSVSTQSAIGSPDWLVSSVDGPSIDGPFVLSLAFNTGHTPSSLVGYDGGSIVGQEVLNCITKSLNANS